MCLFFVLVAAAMAGAWKTALLKLPEEVQIALREDNYPSPEVFLQCFWEEGAANKYSRLDRYGRGLFVVRKVVEVPEDVLEFHPLMGNLRGLLDAAREEQLEKDKQLRDLESGLEEAGY